MSELKFRKKPVTISAIQWTGDNLAEVIEFTDGRKPDCGYDFAAMKWEEYTDLVKREGLKIFTLEGRMSADIGDWIIKGVKGEHYPCKPDIFAMTYEPATQPASAPADILTWQERTEARGLSLPLVEAMKAEISDLRTALVVVGAPADELAAAQRRIADLEQALDIAVDLQNGAQSDAERAEKALAAVGAPQGQAEPVAWAYWMPGHPTDAKHMHVTTTMLNPNMYANQRPLAFIDSSAAQPAASGLFDSAVHDDFCRWVESHYPFAQPHLTAWLGWAAAAEHYGQAAPTQPTQPVREDA